MNRRLFALALLLDVVGAGGALLISTRAWQGITVYRQPPLANVEIEVSGRALDGAILGAILVALAGVVAVLATRGVARRLVGVFIALSGLLLGWRALGAIAAVGHSRAIELATDRKGGVGISSTSVVHIETHPVWAVLTVICALLILASGVLVAVYGERWSTMSARYEAPSNQPIAGDEAMWRALDRGDDPTATTDVQPAREDEHG